MGMEIQVDSLEDMCSLMCDNVIPKRRKGMTREETINELKNLEKFNYTLAPIEVFEMAIKALEQEPKTGHWIDHQEDRWIYAKCSECGSVRNTQTNYCPNCGARMESEVRNET